MINTQDYPRISIVTPSFNQGQYIEQTILSVLSQNYPNLEYIVIDGGSTDNSVEIIKKYEKEITYWVSERDSGQTEAINKGLLKSTGVWFNWINSDDLLMPGALFTLAKGCGAADIFAGVVENFDETGNTELVPNKNLNLYSFFSTKKQVDEPVFHQPGLWLKKAIIPEGGIDNNFQYCFDLDLLLKILLKKPAIVYSDTILARFRLHSQSKTVSLQNRFIKERYQITENFSKDMSDIRFQNQARKKLSQLEWWQKLNSLEKHNQPKFFKVLETMILILIQPSIRFNRLSLGFLLKLMKPERKV